MCGVHGSVLNGMLPGPANVSLKNPIERVSGDVSCPIHRRRAAALTNDCPERNGPMVVRTRRLRTLASLVRLPTSPLSGGGGRGLDTPVEVRWAERAGSSDRPAGHISRLLANEWTSVRQEICPPALLATMRPTFPARTLPVPPIHAPSERSDTPRPIAQPIDGTTDQVALGGM